MIELSRFEMGSEIPKIIHQTYPDKMSLPVEIQKNISNICRLNHNWEYRLYDDADIEAFITKIYGSEILQVYHKINPLYGAARADFFRYLLIYAEGGVYLDIKSSISRPLDDVIAADDRYILSKWDNSENHAIWGRHREVESLDGGEYQQWHIIAVAGHPFLRVVIERVINNIRNYNIFSAGFRSIGVFRVTGPIAYTLAIEDVKSLYPFRQLDIKQDFGIEYSIYEDYKPDVNHRSLFKIHYSSLKKPVIKPSGLRDYFFMIIYYTLYSIVDYLRRIGYRYRQS